MLSHNQASLQVETLTQDFTLHNCNTTKLQSPQGDGNNFVSTLQMPTYWVSSIEGLPISLSKQITIRSLDECPTEKLSGEHIIIADPDAKEVDIKRVGWLADKCSVHGIQGYVASLWNTSRAFIKWQNDNFGIVPFDDWADRIGRDKLDPKEAVKIAQLAEKLKPANYKGEKESLRQRSGYDSYAWNRVTLDTELLDDEDDDQYLKQYLDKVLNEKIIDLDPRQFLPENIAKGLLSFGANQSLPQASLILTFISVVSALHKVGTKVAIAPSTLNFKQNPAINHAILGKSGNGKSIITANLIDTPLKALRKLDKSRFADEFKQYQNDLLAWEKTDKSTPQPEQPKPVNKMYLTGWTMEGLKSYLNNTQCYSVLNSVDELAGLFESFNQYKRGKGNDRQEFLSLYDGRGISEAKVTNPIEIEDSNVAVIGGLQPIKLREYFQLGDSDGMLPRFTFSQLPDVPRYLPEEHGTKVDIHRLLAGIYKAVLDNPASTYNISGEAYSYFRTVDIERQREAHSLPDGARKEFLKKCKGLLARLALNLHLIHELADPYQFTPDNDIPLVRVQQANSIIEFNLKQLESVHRELEDDKITDVIELMVNLSKKRQSVGHDGWLTAREVNHAYTAKKRMKPAEIRNMMIKATELGYGQTRGQGSRLEFLAFVKNWGQTGDNWGQTNEHTSKPCQTSNTENLDKKTGDNWGQTGDNSTTPENIDNTGLQTLDKKTGDTGDSFSYFSECSNLDDSISIRNLSPMSPVEKLELKNLIPQSFELDSSLSPVHPQLSPQTTSELPETHVQQDIDNNLEIVPSLQNINYRDYAKVDNAIKQHWENQRAVGEIYSRASADVKHLINSSATIPNDAKQYIRACYQYVVSLADVENDF